MDQAPLFGKIPSNQDNILYLCAQELSAVSQAGTKWLMNENLN